MGLIKCIKCGKERYSGSNICALCQPKNNKRPKYFLWIVLLFACVFAIHFMQSISDDTAFNPNDLRIEKNTKRDDIYSSISKQELFKISTQRVVASGLKDPQSAKFRNTYFNAPIIDGKKTPIVCGEINAKNSFGGYAGFKRFIGGGNVFSFIDDGGNEFAKSWKMFCR